MKSSRISWFAGFSAALLLGACGRDEPTAPGLHTLSGHVKLIGYLVSAGGDFAGTRVVGDADGVLVELVYGDRVVASARTVDGVYTFHGIAPGAYIARTAGIDPLHDETQPLTVAHSDLSAADTLRLSAQGGHLLPVPNPVTFYTTIYFNLDDTVRVDMRVEDLAGNPVRQIVSDREFFPGLKAAGWDGHDEAGRRATDPMYWLMFRAEKDGSTLGIPDRRIQLLFR